MNLNDYITICYILKILLACYVYVAGQFIIDKGKYNGRKMAAIKI